MPVFAPVQPPRNPAECQPWLYEAIKRLNRHATTSSQGMAAIIRGEAPDSSGNSLVDTTKFFVKPGLPSGQIAYGDVYANGTLTLSSTSSSDKGFIYLGVSGATRIVFDEDNCFLGIGIAPTVRFQVDRATTGTSTVGGLGATLMMLSIAGTAKLLFTTLRFNNTPLDEPCFATNGSGYNFIDNTITTSSMRIAWSSTAAFLQCGRMQSDGTVTNRNLILGSLGAGYATRISLNAQQVDINGSNTDALFGINSPPADRTGTSNFYDQPVAVIRSAYGAQSYYFVCLRLEHILDGASFPSSDGADARKEVFQITGRNHSNQSFAVDTYGRLCLYNPGNGGLDSRLSGRLQPLTVEQDIDATTTYKAFGVAFGINGWTDGSGVGTQVINMGDVQTSVRQCIITSYGTNVFDRFGIHSKLMTICDGTPNTTGNWTPPTAMLHIQSALVATRRLLALQRKASQSVDMVTLWDSDGSTALSGFTSAGAPYLVAGAGTDFWGRSDSAGVLSWVTYGALTKTDDTNVTLTLGGTPTKALLFATSLTLGWTGVLSIARGGTGSSSGPSTHAWVSKTGDYTATSADEVIFVDCTSGPVTITLPTAVGIPGREYTVKKIDSTTNNMTLAGNGSETIDGATTQVTDMQYTAITVISDGANWGII